MIFTTASPRAAKTWATPFAWRSVGSGIAGTRAHRFAGLTALPAFVPRLRANGHSGRCENFPSRRGAVLFPQCPARRIDRRARAGALQTPLARARQRGCDLRSQIEFVLQQWVLMLIFEEASFLYPATFSENSARRPALHCPDSLPRAAGKLLRICGFQGRRDGAELLP